MNTEVWDRVAKPSSVNPERSYRWKFPDLGVELSVTAFWGAYCTPRMDLPLKAYAAVEIAVLREEAFVTPSEVDASLVEFDGLWGGDDVAGYVPVLTVVELIALLTSLEDSRKNPKKRVYGGDVVKE